MAIWNDLLSCAETKGYSMWCLLSKFILVRSAMDGSISPNNYFEIIFPNNPIMIKFLEDILTELHNVETFSMNKYHEPPPNHKKGMTLQACCMSHWRIVMGNMIFLASHFSIGILLFGWGQESFSSIICLDSLNKKLSILDMPPFFQCRLIILILCFIFMKL